MLPDTVERSAGVSYRYWRLAVALAVVLASLWAISRELPRVLPEHGLWDFGSFVASARAARDGLNPYGIYPLTLHVSLPGFESWNPNLNPPISAILFRVFDVPDPAVTFWAWFWVSVASQLAIVMVVLWFQRPSEPVAVAAWIVGLAGFWDTLFLGQIYVPLALAAVGAWCLLNRGAGLWSGILIGVVAAMKPNFLVWPVLLFLAGHRRPAMAALATVLAVSAVPLLVYGPDVYRQWFQLVAADRARAFFLTNASLSGLAARAGVPGLGLVLSVALLGALTVWALWRKPEPARASAFALLAALLASPLGWIHYTLFLVPVVVSRWREPAMAIVALALLVPVPFIIDQFDKAAWVQFTLGSVYAWALVLCLGLLIFREGRPPALAPAAA